MKKQTRARRTRSDSLRAGVLEQVAKPVQSDTEANAEGVQRTKPSRLLTIAITTLAARGIERYLHLIDDNLADAKDQALRNALGVPCAHALDARMRVVIETAA